MSHFTSVRRQLINRSARRPVFLVIAALGALFASACNAHGNGASRLSTAELVAPPQGVFEFCVQRLEECGVSLGDDKAANAAKAEGQETPLLNEEESIEAAIRVNRAVNEAISYRSDLEQWGREEAWLLPISEEGVAYGDCEDYALEKRRELVALGVSEDRLALATAWSRATGTHAVLILRTQAADLVLDNTTPYIVPVGATAYQWIALQSGPSLLNWARVDATGQTRPEEQTLTAGARLAEASNMAQIEAQAG